MTEATHTRRGPSPDKALAPLQPLHRGAPRLAPAEALLDTFGPLRIPVAGAHGLQQRDGGVPRGRGQVGVEGVVKLRDLLYGQPFTSARASSPEMAWPLAIAARHTVWALRSNSALMPAHDREQARAASWPATAAALTQHRYNGEASRATTGDD
jgi:hypothetical protein